MLDDILSSANQFFATLSSGRYSLSRVTAITSGNALGGLDLEVFDAYTGGARAVKPFPVESFFSRLCPWRSVFRMWCRVIPEGFIWIPSLSMRDLAPWIGETLDTAMKALGQLQQNGKDRWDYFPCE